MIRICAKSTSGTINEHSAQNRVLYSQVQKQSKMILSGADVRMALVSRRGELIRCSSITKDDTFDQQIAALDVAIEKLWDAKQIELMEV